MKHIVILLFLSMCLFKMVHSRSESGFFVKGKSIPRVGRSYDGWEGMEGMEGSEDRYLSPFVISPPHGKVIPRMGRRNFDSEGIYDIPKIDSYNQDLLTYANTYNGQLEQIASQ